jgi:raffinose/stachyose/melibiose transport system permease protein
MQTHAPSGQPASTSHKRDYIWGWLFVLPALMLAIPFKIFPLVRGVYESMRHWDSASVSHFVGLANYQRMLTDKTVQAAFGNAFKVVLSLPVWVLTPLVVAFLIFQRAPGWRFYRAVYFLPYTIAPIIVGSIFRQILHTDGPINAVLKGSGLGFLALNWLGNTNTALWGLVAVALWSFFGLGVITYLAGFGTIGEEILEASQLDGAGFWRQFFSIILPLMRPVVGYWTVLCTGGMFIWMFPFIQALTQGGPGFATMLPEYLVYITAFRFLDRGYGTAIGVVLFIFVLVFSVFQVRHMFRSGTRGGGE